MNWKVCEKKRRWHNLKYILTEESHENPWSGQPLLLEGGTEILRSTNHERLRSSQLAQRQSRHLHAHVHFV